MSRDDLDLRLTDWASETEALEAIRREVFIEEQSVPEPEEWDALDAVCVHALIRSGDGTPVATGRLTPDGQIGRMAVRRPWRGLGLGGWLLERLVAEARRNGAPRIFLHAQTYAIPFYSRYGFRAHGPEFDDAGIPHRTMDLIADEDGGGSHG